MPVLFHLFIYLFFSYCGLSATFIAVFLKPIMTFFFNHGFQPIRTPVFFTLWSVTFLSRFSANQNACFFSHYGLWHFYHGFQPIRMRVLSYYSLTCCCLSLRISLVAQVATCLVLCVFDRRPSCSNSLMACFSSNGCTCAPNAEQISL